ncbi:MAG TPA: hypothetical protein VEP90_20245, partial [Methylomirabilota bacterium]|nr:hypothetical protein [Methylomirabilota bacterium]
SYLIIYSILVLVVLLLPVWKTHLYMKNAKSESLEPIAREIRAALEVPDFKYSSSPIIVPSSFERKGIIELMPVVDSLERKYKLFKEEYHVWPFTMPSLRGFIISTASPLFWTIASILIQKYIFP